jgi:hypothetical protein
MIDKKALYGAGMWLLVTAILSVGVILITLLFNWLMNQVMKYKSKRRLKNKLYD